jgi:hypothetical protein
MESNYNEIDDLFREELSEHTEVPPPRVWNALEQRLDKDKKRRIFPFRWYWFVGLLFFITVLAGYFARTGGSDGADGGAAINVAGASVTAPAASDMNAAPAAERNEKLSVNVDHDHVVAERPGVVKNDQKKSGHTKSKGAKKEQVANDMREASTEDVKATANAPTVGTTMYSYDEFDEPVAPRHDETAAAERRQYASAAQSGRHKIAVAELPEALNEAPVKPERIAAVTTPGDEMAPEVIVVRSEQVVAQKEEKKARQGMSQSAETHAVLRAKKKEPVTPAAAASTQPAALLAVANNKNSGAKPKAGVKEVAATGTEKPVKATGAASDQPVATSAAAATTKGAASQKAGVQEVAAELANGKKSAAANTQKESVTSTVAKTIASGKDGVVKKETLISAKTPEKRDLPAAGYVATRDEVAANKGANKEHGVQSAHSKQAQKGSDVQMAKVVSSTGKRPVAQAKAETQREDGKVEADKGGVGRKGPASGKVAVAGIGEDGSVRGAGSPASMVAGKGKVSSASMVAANVPVVKAKPAAEEKAGGKPAKGKQDVDDKAPDSVQEAKVLQSAKNEPAKKVDETKQPEAIDSMVAGKKEDSATDNMSKLTKWAVGLKGGFEMALVGAGSNKVAVSPFLQYRLGKKLSIMVQPAIKGVRQQVRTVGNPGNYYESKSGTGGYRLVDSALLYLVMTGDTLWRRNYEYTEKYDSIVKTYKTGGTYLEFELPVLLRFDVTPKFGVYGGLNMVYSKKQGVREETKVWTDQTAKGEVSTVLPVTAPAILPTTTGLNYTGTPLANYAGPAYPDDRSGLMRMGYMLGVSYEFKKRWLADAMLQQSFVPANLQGGTDLNKPFGVPFIRLTIGYRFGDK